MRPRILVGGQGTPRGFRIAARWADEFNLSSTSAEGAVVKLAELDAACVAVGRDPSTLARSAMVGVLVGATDAEVDRRAADLLVVLGAAGDGRAWLEERRSRWIIGTPDEARATIRRYAEAGIERIMLQDLLPRDGDMIDFMAREFIGRV